MSVRVMEEGPGLVAPGEGRGEKLGSASAQYLIGSQAVRNLNAEFANNAPAVKRWHSGHRRPVRSGTRGRRQENLASRETQEAEGPGQLTRHRRSQHIAIERQRASVVADHQEAPQFHPLCREVSGEYCLFFHSRCPLLLFRSV